MLSSVFCWILVAVELIGIVVFAIGEFLGKEKLIYIGLAAMAAPVIVFGIVGILNAPESSDYICPHCGANIETSRQFCPECYWQIADGQFCYFDSNAHEQISDIQKGGWRYAA